MEMVKLYNDVYEKSQDALTLLRELMLLIKKADHYSSICVKDEKKFALLLNHYLQKRPEDVKYLQYYGKE